MADFTLLFHREKPVDWLLDHFLTTKVCNPEQGITECASAKRLMKRIQPAQFQHVGIHSSLNGKLQKLRDKSFIEEHVIRPLQNPPLDRIYSNIISYGRFSLTTLYNGYGTFWGPDHGESNFVLISIALKKYLFIIGSIIVFVFKNEVNVKSIRLLSGGEHPTDIIPPDSQISLSKPGVTFPAGNNFPEEYFKTVGLVGSDGIFEKKFEEPFKKTRSLRIQMSSKTEYWLWINGIYIETVDN